MKLLKQTYVPILSLILLVVALMPLFQPGFFPIHDDQQIARLHELNLSLQGGQFPPRWVSNLGFGFGYPLFIFYPPLVYYIGEMFYLLGFSLINSTKIVIGLGFVLSFSFMYVWIRDRFGKRAGLFAATLYTYAPYHALDIYVRGALAEFFSFVFMPLVFWASDKLSEKKTVFLAILVGIFLSLLVLTHNLIALPFMFFFIVYVIYLLLSSKEKKKLIILFFISGLVAIGLSAYFWIPAILEKQYTLVDSILTKELASYNLHFVYLRQFWNSPWGFGGSLFGLEDGLSFQIGKIQAISVLLSVVLFIIMIFRKYLNPKTAGFPLVAFILFSVSIFMASFYSEPVWNIMQFLAYIQFPWRFLLFTAVFTSALGGFLIYSMEKILPQKIVFLSFTLLILITIFSVNSFFKPSKHLNVKDSFYLDNYDIEWRVSDSSYEYVPKQVATKLSEAKTTKLDIEKNEIPKKSFVTPDSGLNIIEQINKPHYKKYKAEGSGGLLQVNTYYYPGWRAYIDGKEVEINPLGKHYLISFPIPYGEHFVEVKFTNTNIVRVANLISLFTLVSVLSYHLLLVLKLKKIYGKI